MSIESNIKAREAAESFMADSVTWATLSGDEDRFWEVVLRMVKDHVKEKGGDGSMTDIEAKRWEHNTKMPFGAHQGKLVEQVPLDYLVWLGDEQFMPALKRYLKAPMVQDEIQRL